MTTMAAPAEALVTAARMLGWRMTTTGQGSTVLHPDGDVGGDPVVLNARGELNADLYRRNWRRIVRARKPGIPDGRVAFVVQRALADAKVDAEHRRQVWNAIGLAEPKRPPTPEPDADDPTPPPATVASCTPWLAVKEAAKGTRYPSKAVLDRTWTDGHHDYICADDGCTWTHDDPRRVAWHYGAAHTRGNGPQPLAPGVRVDPPQDPAVRRAARLANEIDAAMSAGATTADDIARHIIDNRDDAGTPHEPEPDTVESVLDRIIGLATAAKALPSADTATVHTLTEALTAETERADRAEGYIRSLRDLMAETAP